MDQHVIRFVVVAGARPNFMKIAPILKAIARHNRWADDRARSPAIQASLLHTGQHYDYEMSKVFFEDLDIPDPDIHLGVGSGSHGEQTGKALIGIEKVLIDRKPDLLLVVGDVNSTLAGALAAVKLHVRVAHVEAGLRSFDMTMPEEVNRVLTDAISDYLYVHSPDAIDNLKREGITGHKIRFVGNVMADSLLDSREKATRREFLGKAGLVGRQYCVVTLHRPDNVDRRENLTRIAHALRRVSDRVPVVFPCHPRTMKTITDFGLGSLFEYHRQPDVDGLIGRRVHLITPLGYLDFLQLMTNSKAVVTDSGGIQEETTMLGVPCITLREATERPITVTEGTNTLVGSDPAKIVEATLDALDGKSKIGKVPHLWDGKAAERIIESICEDG